MGKFWSEAGEAEYRRTYDAARSLWPEHEVRRVGTDFGTAQALILSKRNSDSHDHRAPVVLLHGMSATSLS